jgi:hypothetical protein
MILSRGSVPFRGDRSTLVWRLLIGPLSSSLREVNRKRGIPVRGTPIRDHVEPVTKRLVQEDMLPPRSLIAM